MASFDGLLGLLLGCVATAAQPPKPTILAEPAEGRPDRLAAGLRAVAPHLSAGEVEVWSGAMRPPMRSAGITTPRRVALFLGQCAVESACFTELSEDMRYSPPRLCAVFPREFPTVDGALSYAYRPQAIACRVYAGRLGNGDEASGDGWKFRGGGMIQLTGREEYQRFADAVRQPLDQAAAWVRTPPGAAASACWFWGQRALNVLADGWDISEATRRITGCMIENQRRIDLCNAALRAVGDG